MSRRPSAQRTYGLLGVPSSAAAHWPGIERGPAAFRAAGLVDELLARGVAVVDHGDLPEVRWVADRPDDRPNAWRRVVAVVERTRRAAAELLDAGHVPLVLGGECTLTVGLVAAVLGRGPSVGLVYVDGGQDLMVPADHPREPILDGMGVAHLLDLPGCLPELAAVGARRPLLRPGDVAFIGYGDEEEDVHGLVPTPRFPAPEVVADPVAAARAVLGSLPHDHLVLHLDVDVLDALRLPLADVAAYGSGLGLEHLGPLLTELVVDPRVVALALVEANPDHDDAALTSTRALVRTFADALAAADGPP